MKKACFMITVLLAAVLVNATSMAVHEAKDSIPSSLVKGLRGFLEKIGGIWTLSRRDGVGAENMTDATRMSVRVGTKEDGFIGRNIKARVGTKEEGLIGENTKACMTLELCKKKKMICSKKCSKPQSGRIDKKHIPGKCVVKCKKCIPNC